MSVQPQILVLGAGGHAKVLIAAIRARGNEVHGVLDSDESRHGQEVLGVQILGGDEALLDFLPESCALVNGIGSVGPGSARRNVFETFRARGYRFPPVIHPFSWMASDVAAGEGSQLMAGIVVQPGVAVGCNTIINTRTSVDHDCVIGDHVHLAPGVTLCGNVRVGAGVHIGTGAIVVQGVEIGENAFIEAGAVVTKSVSAGARILRAKGAR